MTTPRAPRPLTLDLTIAAALVGVVVLARILPHAPNAAPVAAAAMFAGWFFRSRLLAIAAPAAAMLVSDAVIGGYHPAVMLVVYASLIAPVFFRRLLGDGSGLGRLAAGAAAGSLAGSILFYLTTNFAVWCTSAGYAKSVAGLVECYTNAIPFFRLTALGDLAYTAAIFAAWAAAHAALATRRPALAHA